MPYLPQEHYLPLRNALAAVNERYQLRIGYFWLYSRVRSGDIPAERFGSKWYINPTHLADIAEAYNPGCKRRFE